MAAPFYLAIHGRLVVVGVLVWSPLAGGLLSGKYRRGKPGPAGSRLLSGWDGWSGQR